MRVGSASKTFWGGLRIGWMRAPQDRMDRLFRARLSLDLGAPLLEQLVLRGSSPTRTRSLAGHRERLRAQRDALVAASPRSCPTGGSASDAAGSTCGAGSPGPRDRAAAEAERHGVLLAAGPSFAPRAASTASSGSLHPPGRRARRPSPGSARPGSWRGKNRDARGDWPRGSRSPGGTPTLESGRLKK